MKVKLGLYGHGRSYDVTLMLKNQLFLIHFFCVISNFIKILDEWYNYGWVQFVKNNYWPKRSLKVNFMIKDQLYLISFICFIQILSLYGVFFVHFYTNLNGLFWTDLSQQMKPITLEELKDKVSNNAKKEGTPRIDTRGASKRFFIRGRFLPSPSVVFGPCGRTEGGKGGIRPYYI